MPVPPHPCVQPGTLTMTSADFNPSGRIGVEKCDETAPLGTEQAVNLLLAAGISNSAWDRSVSVRSWNPAERKSGEGSWYPNDEMNFPGENTPETAGCLSSPEELAWGCAVFTLRWASPWSFFLLPLTHYFRCLSQLLMLSHCRLPLIGALHSYKFCSFSFKTCFFLPFPSAVEIWQSGFIKQRIPQRQVCWQLLGLPWDMACSRWKACWAFFTWLVNNGYK